MVGDKNALLLVSLFVCSIYLCSSDATRPNSEQLTVMSDALKYLQDLDAYYSEVSRPSARSDPGSPSSINALKNTLKYIRLQELGKMFDSKGRPRFGKRFGLAFNGRPVELMPADAYAKPAEKILGGLNRR